jgi:hypothetical protein
MGLESKLNASVQELKADILRSRAELDARIGELETKMERNKTELIRWVFLVMLGNVALSAATTALLNALKHIG